MKSAAPRRIVLLLAGSLLIAGCRPSPGGAAPPAHSAAPSEPAAAFASPPAWPGYGWMYEGRPVGWEVVASAAGPEHCGWQRETFLTIGWPPGTPSTTSTHARQYIRDPDAQLTAVLPRGSVPTGLTYGALTIYLGPDAGATAAYVVGQKTAERWPRREPMAECV